MKLTSVQELQLRDLKAQIDQIDRGWRAIGEGEQAVDAAGEPMTAEDLADLEFYALDSARQITASLFPSRKEDT